MKGTVYLGGGGDETQAAAIDAIVFDSKNYARNSINCLFVPVALNPRKYGEAERWFSSSYGNYCDNVNLCVNLYDLDYEKLRQYNLVYIGGGDTGRLMDQIEKSGFKSLIPEFIDAGGYVFGGSAGAIAMGKSVLTAPEDEETATLTTGINCIGDWSAYPHYDNNSAEEVRELARRLNSNIVAIPEESGVIYDGELIAVGAGVEFFYARR